mgnify:CR=1 FL=1
MSVIAYGSYADGSHNADSDFDALVITESHEVFHDVSFVEGIQLDVFVGMSRRAAENFQAVGQQPVPAEKPFRVPPLGPQDLRRGWGDYDV